MFFMSIMYYSLFTFHISLYNSGTRRYKGDSTINVLTTMVAHLVIKYLPLIKTIKLHDVNISSSTQGTTATHNRTD